MTVAGRDTENEHLEREAHWWVTRLVSGEATTDDAMALDEWCARSPDHAAAFAGATRRWKDFGPAGRTLLEEGRIPTLAPSPPTISRRFALGGAGALAASAAAYALVTPPFGLWPSLAEMAADYRTATGEQRHINLAADVSVRLNTQTSIALMPSPEIDRVRLLSGEAGFSTQASRPLVVLAGGGRSEATRARFQVRAFGDTVTVTCLEGEIRADHGSQSAAIGPQHQLRYGPGGLGPAVGVDPAEVAAWQDGILVFRFTPLEDVIVEINRYRSGRVILVNAALGRNPVNGRFRIQRIDEVLTWIEQAFGATARFLPAGLVLVS
ncbi:MAG: FecR domain-containing protein [Rhodoplanes sp.]|uniref:FecR family protein n=1 Tax=Rhodoplanes sp. TaxID=1968906 RepID=UPI0017F51CB4|nr:FecR domain-containing protein [Rhodoplanes sp.]NVO17600.1 FecR domain-containing protein [Rhodoplanes sp.]